MAKLPVFDAGRSFDMTTVTGAYQAVGGIIQSPTYGFVIFNTSDVAAQVSLDGGATNGPILPAGSTFDASRFNQLVNVEDATFMLPDSSQISVRQVTGAATSGDLIINVARQ